MCFQSIENDNREAAARDAHDSLATQHVHVGKG